MSSPEWQPEEKIESLFERALKGNKWAGTNAPTAGARTEKDVPVGEADFQLYSLATPVHTPKEFLHEVLQSNPYHLASSIPTLTRHVNDPTISLDRMARRSASCSRSWA